MTPERGAEANACGLLGRTRTLTEWRSGFNRYRRTWAGPELTTEPVPHGAGQGQQRETFLPMTFPFPFHAIVRIAYASHYPYILGVTEGAKAASCVVHHMYAAISLLSAWSTNGPWDRQCGGYTKSSTGGTCNEKTGPRRTGMVGRDQGRGIPDPVQHSIGWEPDVGPSRTTCGVEQVPRHVHILIMCTIDPLGCLFMVVAGCLVVTCMYPTK